jgi:hypothetical protein
VCRLDPGSVFSRRQKVLLAWWQVGTRDGDPFFELDADGMDICSMYLCFFRFATTFSISLLLVRTIALVGKPTLSMNSCGMCTRVMRSEGLQRKLFLHTPSLVDPDHHGRYSTRGCDSPPVSALRDTYLTRSGLAGSRFADTLATHRRSRHRVNALPSQPTTTTMHPSYSTARQQFQQRPHVSSPSAAAPHPQRTKQQPPPQHAPPAAFNRDFPQPHPHQLPPPRRLSPRTPPEPRRPP